MAAPVIRGNGGYASGTGAITPSYNGSTAVGDLALMFIETTGGETPTCSGWTAAPSSPQSVGSGTTGTKLTVLYRIVSNLATDNRTTNDPGDHCIATIVTIAVGTFNSSNPFNVSAGGTAGTATTLVSIPSVTTTVDDCLIVGATSGDLPDANGTSQFTFWSNGNLTGLTELFDVTRNAGNGGALGGFYGEKTTAGSTGVTTATASTSAVRGYVTLAIEPAPAAARRIFVM